MKMRVPHPLICVSILMLLTFVLTAFNRAGRSRPAEPSVIVECFDRSLEVYAPMWQKEIDRRFDNAVGILVHGGDFVHGQWIVGTSNQPWKHVTLIQDLVREVQEKYPTRTVVLLACNTGHLKLDMPGVYYAMSSVWCVPDRAITPEMMRAGLDRIKFDSGFEGYSLSFLSSESRWESDPDVVGNIYEFVCD